MVDRSAHERNRAAWNRATPRHNAHKRDQPGFLRGGGSTLFPEELDLLGDLSRARVAHLCCNSGQDTLSLVHHGAVVTGVDISDAAIDFARALSRDSGLCGEFVRADVYDWLRDAPDAAFDRVFLSYGALDWLSDLDALFAGVHRVLKPGGHLVIVEFHLLAFIMTSDNRLMEPYFADPRTEPGGLDDYVGFSDGGLTPMGTVDVLQEPLQAGPVTFYGWHTAQIVDAVARSGMVLERLVEWPFTNGWRPFPDARRMPGRRWTWPSESFAAPLMYGLRARRA